MHGKGWLLFALSAALLLSRGTVPAATETSPFADAVAAWQMADLNDSAGNNSRLEVRGDVRVGVPLSGPEREASLARGGDGKVAHFLGGWLDAGQGADGELNLAGKAMTLAVRLRDPSGQWNCPLFSKHGGHQRLVYNLFSTDLGWGMVLGFEMGTTGNEMILRTSIPLAQIGPTEWHDVVCRADGAKLEMFVDGRCVDEDFLLGSLRPGNLVPCLIGAESYGERTKSGFRGTIDHAALWNRALSDAEIAALAGGRDAVVRRERTDRGDPRESMQYWRPPNRYYVGDCLPFFHDDVFHFFYLLDKDHHRSKNGLGAHQWAQATSTDLVHWKHQPLAIPITEPWEGSICTGSAFYHDGTYYGFYATRMPDRTQHLGVATSRDGIHFTKRQPNPFASPPPGYDPHHYRDPTVFEDRATGRFHMLVTAMQTEGNRGCLAHLVSGDLQRWEAQNDPFYVPGLPGAPECPDHFAWNGWYYLVFSNGGLARYRLSRSPLGPWETPAVDVFGSPLERVAKTAAFRGNRRLSVSFLADGGYAGQAVFRELVQHDDGSLGTRFVPEMIPSAEPPLTLDWLDSAGATFGEDRRTVILSPLDAPAEASVGGLPAGARIRMRVVPKGGPGVFGVRLRAGEAEGDGLELRFDMSRKRVRLGDGAATIDQVEGLDRPFTLDVILKEDIVDVCVDDRRTLISRVARRAGDRLRLFAEDVEVSWQGVEIRPLRKPWAMGPFVKRDRPILEPNPQATFFCPVTQKPVHWEAQNVYNPAVVVRDGKVHLLYRADDTPRPEGWGRTCRIGLASSDDGLHFTRRPDRQNHPPFPVSSGADP